MRLKRIERLGDITQVRVMMGAKLTSRVEAYLRYYEQIYDTPIDLREFGMLAFEAILDSDTDFAKWAKKQSSEGASTPTEGTSNGSKSRARKAVTDADEAQQGEE